MYSERRFREGQNGIRLKHARSSKLRCSRQNGSGCVVDLAGALFLRAQFLPNIHTPHADYVLWSLVRTFRWNLLLPYPSFTEEQINSQQTTRFSKQVSVWSRRLVHNISPRRTLVDQRPSNMSIWGEQRGPRTCFPPSNFVAQGQYIASIFYTDIL